MSNNTEQSGLSLVLADHAQNYYVIPVEAFERGRVPAERKAEVEEAMREHDVSGYTPFILAVGFAIGAEAAVIGMVGAAAAGLAAGAAYNALSSDCYEPPKPLHDPNR